MAEHIHSVYDTDLRFTIDPVTRAIKNGSGKAVIVQHDHNSERVTFELPRTIDGHDMTLCNLVEVQYINIDATSKETAVGVYEVADLAASGTDRAVCSWLISCNATKYAGKLTFMLRFMCVDDDGTVTYAWNTAIFTELTVSAGMDNGEAIVVEYADILAAWDARITALENKGKALPEVTAEDNDKILQVVDGAWAAVEIATWGGGDF